MSGCLIEPEPIDPEVVDRGRKAFAALCEHYLGPEAQKRAQEIWERDTRMLRDCLERMAEKAEPRIAVDEEMLARQREAAGGVTIWDEDRSEKITSHPVLCWFSRNGAEQGTPWCVQHTDGSQELVSAVRMTGVVDFIAAPEGLLDGPRFVARLVEGQMMAGK